MRPPSVGVIRADAYSSLPNGSMLNSPRSGMTMGPGW